MIIWVKSFFVRRYPLRGYASHVFAPIACGNMSLMMWFRLRHSSDAVEIKGGSLIMLDCLRPVRKSLNSSAKSSEAES